MYLFTDFICISQEDHINLKVVGADNSEVHFKIKKTTQLKELKQAYADRQVDSESIK